MIAVAAVLLLASSAFGQGNGPTINNNVATPGTSNINKLVPEPLAAKTTAAGVLIVTPAFPARRRLAEDVMEDYSEVRALGRRLLANATTAIPNGGGVTISSGANSYFGSTFSAPTSSGRKLLAVPFVFYGEVLQTAISQQAVGNYVFDSQAIPFLTAATSPPASSGLKFIQAVLSYPQEQTATNVPAFAVSTTGFLPASASSPVIVQLETQTPQGVAPNVALRFDYSQTGAGLTPFVSVLYTDFVGAIPIGLPAKAASAGAPAINIAQSFGLFISQNGTLYPGQG